MGGEIGEERDQEEEQPHKNYKSAGGKHRLGHKGKLPKWSLPSPKAKVESLLSV